MRSNHVLYGVMLASLFPMCVYAQTKPANSVTAPLPINNSAISSPLIQAPTLSLADDFLIQKVCVDSKSLVLNINNKPAMAMDPYKCDKKLLRPLKVGEALPYRKHDWKQAGDTSYNPNGFQYSDSFPLPNGKGGVQYISSMRFAEGATLKYNAANFANYHPDGYNVIDASDGWANFAGTKDNSGPAQSFYGPGCQRSKSWALFPLTLKPGNWASIVASLKLIREGETCDGSTQYDKSYSPSEYFATPLTYTSGKTLNTIISYHYGTESISQTAAYKGAGYEVTYFTNLYGLTRWEAWSREQDGGQPVGMPYCNGNPKVTDGAGNKWVRVDCRDWSYTTTTDYYGSAVNFSPYSVKLDKVFHTPNLLQETDFTDAWGGAWQRYDGNALIHWALGRDAETGRKHLGISCAGACNGNVLYQRVELPAQSMVAGAAISYGSRIWVDSGTVAGSLQLFMFDATGKVVGTANKNVSVTANKDRSHWGETQLAPGTTAIIWAFYPANRDTVYNLTNPWLVVR